jgi:uncharacterized protein YecE (DUF72 family)
LRNREWQRSEVYAEMEKRKLVMVTVDYPELRGLPAWDPVVTGDFEYARLHGRNAQNWWEGDSTSRYDYLYSEEEIKELSSKLGSVSAKSKILYVAFNNHYKAQAVKNGLRLQQLLLNYSSENSLK